MVILFCFVASGTVTNLFPTVVKTLGYSSVISLLLTVPPYVLAVITTFLNAWHADKTGERYFHITGPMYFAVIAFISEYFAGLPIVPSETLVLTEEQSLRRQQQSDPDTLQ